MPPHPHERHTLQAIDATRISLPRRLSWFGVPFTVPQGGADLTRSLLVEALASILYRQFYCLGRAVPLPAESAPRISFHEAKAFLRTLAEANRAHHTKTTWQVESVSGEVLHIRRNGLRIKVGRGEWSDAGDPGRVTVPFAPGSIAISPGYFLVDRNLSDYRGPVLRIYWNISPAGAPLLVRHITSALRESSTAYAFKVLADLAQYHRCDSAVLYLGTGDPSGCSDLIEKVWPSIHSTLRREVPIFTRELAPGIALAEQPEDDSSFGHHRSRLLAEGLMLAAEAGLSSATDRLARVVEHFHAKKVSFDTPYLSRRTALDFDVHMPAVTEIQPRSASKSTSIDHLEAAARIGHHLVRTAVWDGRQCNWVGSVVGAEQAFGALGGELYAGTSGIAWFLAELYRRTGAADLRKTAEGAIRQSLDAAAAIDAGSRTGLYVGVAGIAFASIRCAELLDLPGLRVGGRRLLRELDRASGGPVAADVLSGEAGAILALSALSALTGDSASELDVRFGKDLVRSAMRSGDRWSWRTINRRGTPNLTGYSHGTSGIAAALLVLFAKTRYEPFRDAAEGALRYDHWCFDQAACNWPDYRDAASRSAVTGCTRAWCHGAPGIALTLTLADQVLGDQDWYRTDASAALVTTRHAVHEGIRNENSFCLCHGIAGNADILSLASSPRDRAVVDAADFGVGHYRSRPWPVGAGLEVVHGLMTGTAGIGHFYLRLYDPEVASPLAIGLPLHAGALRNERRPIPEWPQPARRQESDLTCQD